MFGRVFELRVDYWVRCWVLSRFTLVSSLIAMSRRLYLGSMLCFTFTVTIVLIIAIACRAPSGHQVR